MTNRRWTARLLAATIAVAGLLFLPAQSTAGPSIGQLHQQLGQQQAHSQQLQSSLARLGSLISSLNSQISLVRSREAAVQATLSHDRSELAATEAQLRVEHQIVAMLDARLAQAQHLLSVQLVANYESGGTDLVDVVLNSKGFADLLERITFLKDAEREQQGLISVTRRDKGEADAAAQRLAKLQAKQMSITHAALLESRALIGMNQLLDSKQAALQRSEALQRSSLSASQSKSSQIQGEISHIEAQQAAAARAAAARQAAANAAASSPSSSSSSSTPPPSSGPTSYGPWAIPAAIVMCESGGQNLPPNSAGASGYYQIIPSTWTGYGGTGPAAYLAPKSEQDAVASRIWNGGAGASAWVCASIVGIT
jgi:peptidoglycan hydrolase CwlO-like protein